jgi:hypothetical protein
MAPTRWVLASADHRAGEPPSKRLALAALCRATGRQGAGAAGPPPWSNPSTSCSDAGTARASPDDRQPPTLTLRLPRQSPRELD